MTFHFTDLPLDRHGLLHRGPAHKAGLSDDRLSAAVKKNELIRLASGVYTLPQPADQAKTEAGRDAHYRLTCLASATTARSGDAPLSHQSAAAIHRLPMLSPDRRFVHFIRGGSGGSSLRGSRYRHAGTVPEEDVVVVDGIRVTSLRRTAVDVGMSGTFAQALTAIDAAMRRGVSREELFEVLAGRRPEGVRTARRAIDHGNGLSESVGESWSRAQMIDADLPIPVLQREYVLEGHRQEPDFDWDGRLVGEFDGHVKYQGLLLPGEQPHDAVIREKEREDRFRRAHIDVVRWTWNMLVQGKLIPLLRHWLRHVGIVVD